MLTRRVMMFGTLALTFGLFSPSAVEAGVARALDLKELVRNSERVVLGTPLDAYSVWEQVGNSRRIVTYSRLQVDETLLGPQAEAEMMVRTLGGRVGDIGQIVHGEAAVVSKKRAMLFVRTAADGTQRIVARTQGYYLVERDASGTLRLRQSPRQSALVGLAARSAIKQLVGLPVSDVRRRLREALTR